MYASSCGANKTVKSQGRSVFIEEGRVRRRICSRLLRLCTCMRATRVLFSMQIRIGTLLLHSRFSPGDVTGCVPLGHACVNLSGADIACRSSTVPNVAQLEALQKSS